MTETDTRIIEAVEEMKDSLLKGVRELVSIESVKAEGAPGAPFGRGVKQALIKALELSRELGFETVDVDGYLGYAVYGNGEDYVCAMGHVDVVPAGDGWKQPPFSAYRENGRIYGRGVLDNKGPVLCCLYGLYALKKLGLELKHPVRILFGCDEESGFEDLAYYLKKEAPPVYGFTPDCKYPVIYSERGRAMLRIAAGKDRLKDFFRFVSHYIIGASNSGDRLGIDYYHPEYGTLEMRNYRLEEEGEEAAFYLAVSYPQGISIEEIMARIREKSEGLSLTLQKNYDPVVFSKDSPMVMALKESYETVTGLDGTPVTTTGGTYAKVMPNIVPFGPSFPGQKGISHNPNEWMDEKDLIANAKIYALSLYRLGML